MEESRPTSESSDENSGEQEEEMSFEASLARLEKVVERLEEGELDLDESLQLYEQGIESYRRCHKILQEATGKMEKLVDKMEGVLQKEPFGPPGEEE